MTERFRAHRCPGEGQGELNTHLKQTNLREYADLYRVILCRDCNKKTTAVFHIVGMKCGEEGCGSYNTTMDAGPLLR